MSTLLIVLLLVVFGLLALLVVTLFAVVWFAGQSGRRDHLRRRTNQTA